jgi:predicted secreted Zn-dependent protease
MLSFVYLILISLSGLSSSKQDNSLIDWNADKKLTWKDFKAEPEKGYAAAALTSTNIKIDFGYYNEMLQYHIRCRFDKNKSWGRVKNDYILSHEQAHFDIAEIYARKLNKVLKAYKPNENNISKEVNKIYENLMHEYYERQEEYDKETNFSINKIKQEEWLKKVSNELNDLKNYSNYN